MPTNVTFSDAAIIGNVTIDGATYWFNFASKRVGGKIQPRRCTTNVVALVEENGKKTPVEQGDEKGPFTRRILDALKQIKH